MSSLTLIYISQVHKQNSQRFFYFCLSCCVSSWSLFCFTCTKQQLSRYIYIYFFLVHYSTDFFQWLPNFSSFLFLCEYFFVFFFLTNSLRFDRLLIFFPSSLDLIRWRIEFNHKYFQNLKSVTQTYTTYNTGWNTGVLFFLYIFSK